MVYTILDLYQQSRSKPCYIVGKRRRKRREVAAMFMDEVIFAGLLIIGLTCAFFVGLYIAIKKDIEKHGTGE